MRINHLPRSITALAVVMIAAAFGLGETWARAQLFGNPYRVKVKEKGYYTGAVVVSPYVPTTYVQAAPVVVAQTRVVRRRVIQPAPLVETGLLQPAPIIESRVDQPPAVVESEVIRLAPVIERSMYISSYPY